MLDGKAILVVDDEPDLREILSDEFRHAGAIVHEAANGQEALRQSASQHFDVIVTDLRMPGGDGFSLARALKARNTISPILVLMTGFADLTAEEAFDVGVEAFLTKPFHLDAIRENIERLLTPSVQRWSGRGPSDLRPLDPPPVALVGQESLSYLGRGGMFWPGSVLQVRVGEEVSFTAGPELSGTGVVRWVRPSSEAGRGCGLGLEFLSLEETSRKWVAAQIEMRQPIAFLPRGF